MCASIISIPRRSLTMKLLVICLLLVPVFGLSASAAGQSYGKPFSRQGWKLLTSLQARGRKTPVKEEAKSQLDPVSTTLLTKVAVPLALKGARFLAQCALCDEGCPLEVQLQSDTDQNEKIAKLMAVMDALESINAAEKKLDALKRSLMKDNQMAEAQVLGSIWSGVKRAGKFVKGLAKDVVCNE